MNKLLTHDNLPVPLLLGDLIGHPHLTEGGPPHHKADDPGRGPGQALLLLVLIPGTVSYTRNNKAFRECSSIMSAGFHKFWTPPPPLTLCQQDQHRS